MYSWSRVLEWSGVRIWSGKSRIECSCYVCVCVTDPSLLQYNIKLGHTHKSRMECSCDVCVCVWPSFMLACYSDGSHTHTRTRTRTHTHTHTHRAALHSTFATPKSDSTPLQYSTTPLHRIHGTLSGLDIHKILSE